MGSGSLFWEPWFPTFSTSFLNYDGLIADDPRFTFCLTIYMRHQQKSAAPLISLCVSVSQYACACVLWWIRKFSIREFCGLIAHRMQQHGPASRKWDWLVWVTRTYYWPTICLQFKYLGTYIDLQFCNDCNVLYQILSKIWLNGRFM